MAVRVDVDFRQTVRFLAAASVMTLLSVVFWVAVVIACFWLVEAIA